MRLTMPLAQAEDKTDHATCHYAGCLITTGCLVSGLMGFVAGDSKHMQRMMRARVVAQGLTVAAMMGGLIYAAYKKERKRPAPTFGPLADK